MSRSNLQVVRLDEPLHLEAIGVTAEFVGLGRMQDAADSSIFIQIAANGSPELASILHVNIENARFLRDSIDFALTQHRVRTCEYN